MKFFRPNKANRSIAVAASPTTSTSEVNTLTAKTSVATILPDMAAYNWLAVAEDAELSLMATRLHQCYRAELICVVNSAQQLLGIIHPAEVYERLVYLVAPQPVLKKLINRHPRFNYSSFVYECNAAELMQQVNPLKMSDSLAEAYFKLERARSDFLPVVTEQNQIKGCLGLKDLVRAWATAQTNAVG